MAAFTTAAIVGAAVVGAAATVHSVSQQKKAAKEQSRRLDQREQEAREAASLDEARTDTGADISLGRGDATTTPVSSGAGEGASTSRSGAVNARVGGLGGTGVGGAMKRGKRPSQSVGL